MSLEGTSFQQDHVSNVLSLLLFSGVTFRTIFLHIIVDELLYDKNRLSVQPCISPTNPTRTMKTFLTCFTRWKVMAQCSV